MTDSSLIVGSIASPVPLMSWRSSNAPGWQLSSSPWGFRLATTR